MWYRRRSGTLVSVTVRPSLLIVDDRADVLRTIARYMSLHFEVHAVRTVEEAEACLTVAAPSRVLCDYWLGRKVPNGGELLFDWRQRFACIEKTALMTGTKTAALEALPGVDRVFAKPLNFDRVASWLLEREIEAPPSDPVMRVSRP